MITAMQAIMPDPRIIERDKRAWLESIQPLIAAKARVYSLVMPEIIHVEGASMPEVKYEFTADQQAYIDHIDSLIEAAMPVSLRIARDMACG